ncbi:MAG: NUDIX domain-containing protein [Candidatus Avoscillospira sp.]
MEILDVVDAEGRPTGGTVAREDAHRLGIRHRTAHVWILRRRDGRVQVLLQKRSPEKDAYPGCYDIPSAGHIPAGVDFVPSALRELQEELGVEARAEDLILCGQRVFQFEQVFHGRPFRDNQVSNVYLLWLDREPEDFTLQEEEVTEVRWFEFEACVEAVKTKQIPNCIFPEELAMVSRTFRTHCNLETPAIE